MQSEWKIFQLQSRSYAIRCINQRFAFKNSGIAYLVLIFNWNNPRTTILHAKKAIPGCEKLRVIYCFFQETRTLIRTFDSVIKAASRRMLKLFAAPLPFCVSPSIHWHTRFYTAALSIIFIFLDFVSGDLALTGFSPLTWTSDFHCFGALGVGPGALTRPYVQAWRMGGWQRLQSLGAKVTKGAWPLFSLNCRK